MLRYSEEALASRIMPDSSLSAAEIGTHQELMALGGKYAEMFHRQAENYLGESYEESEVRANG